MEFSVVKSTRVL